MPWYLNVNIIEATIVFKKNQRPQYTVRLKARLLQCHAYYIDTCLRRKWPSLVRTLTLYRTKHSHLHFDYARLPASSATLSVHVSGPSSSCHGILSHFARAWRPRERVRREQCADGCVRVHLVEHVKQPCRVPIRFLLDVHVLLHLRLQF